MNDLQSDVPSTHLLTRIRIWICTRPPRRSLPIFVVFLGILHRIDWVWFGDVLPTQRPLQVAEERVLRQALSENMNNLSDFFQ